MELYDPGHSAACELGNARPTALPFSPVLGGKCGFQLLGPSPPRPTNNVDLAVKEL